MALTSGALDEMLDAFAAVGLYVSLHTAEPNGSGSNEVSGGDYGRELADWASASGGSVVNNGDIVLTVPGSTTITHIGYWSASTAGTFYGWRVLDSSQTFATAGTYTIAAGNLSESVE
jgi:hypothetical protein